MGESGPNPSILHVDMDAFFAAVEALDSPGLAGKPLIVGGTGARGVVASCSYEARSYGVHSAMSAVRARQLCPHAVFVGGRYERYSELSRQIHSVFLDYTPLVEGISLDEAFLDVSGASRLFGSPADIAWTIRDRISAELGLACSVGVARVKFLAKLASESAKPKADRAGPVPGLGVAVIEPERELEFLHALPIEALWGVGPATSSRLRRLGVTSVGDLAEIPVAALESALGRSAGTHLSNLAHAIDDRPVEPDREVKSISHEETYPTDIYDPDELHVEVVRMSDAVATRLRRAGMVGRTVNLKVRYGDFVTKTRAKTSPAGLAAGPAIARLAAGLLEEIDIDPGVRLLGVGVSNLGPAGTGPAEQMTLDFGLSAAEGPLRSGASPTAPLASGTAGASAVSASDAVDAVRQRYGDASVGPAALLGGRGIRVKRRGDNQWGPNGAPADSPDGAPADRSEESHPSGQ